MLPCQKPCQSPCQCQMVSLGGCSVVSGTSLLEVRCQSAQILHFHPIISMYSFMLMYCVKI